jgi:hypothetical protein
MAGKIFVNYRHEDGEGFVQFLHHHLVSEFAPGALFMDVNIELGDDFPELGCGTDN